MTAGPWLLTNAARTKILDGTFASGSSWKVGLALSTSNLGATSTTYAGLTGEVATANGYTVGGIAVTMALVGTTSVTESFVTNPTWTATGAGITARTAFLYKVGGDIMAYSLLNATNVDDFTASGQTLTIDSDGVPSPVVTLA